MADWRERILNELTPGVARLTLVADPDGLLLEEALLGAIRERGFELITFEDPAAFRIMHGMELGAAGMLNQVRQWAGEGFMARLLDALLDSGFAVFLTADHGNVEAVGCGRPAEGAIADLRGERVRIYPDPMLRARVKERLPDAIEWPALGVPEDCLALLAPGRAAFIREGDRIVGHGGISLEEVIVPMVRIERARHEACRPGRIQPAHPVGMAGVHGQLGLGRKLERRDRRRAPRPTEREAVGRKRAGAGQPGQDRHDPDPGLGHGPPPELRTLRDDGLDLLRSSEANDRVLVHWCMCTVVYPFFGTVAEAAGQLLRLQGTAGAAQVQRRIRERMGERDTVARAARRILRVFIDWGVLLDTGEKGLYRGAVRLAVDGRPPLALWTARAMLSAMGDGPRPASALLRGPRLFPFDIAPPPTSELEACESLETTRHGLDHELLLGLAGGDMIQD